MKRFLLVALSIITAFTASATYVTVPVTGFTDDVVANGATTALLSTTNTADGGSAGNQFVFIDATFNAGAGTPTVYLPTGGLFTTVVATTPGLQFQLASYSANNDLRLQSNQTGTLTFATPQSASQLFLAAFCGNGSMPTTVTVNFTDGTTQVMGSVTVADWFGNTGFAIQGVGRAERASNGIQNNTTDPRIYQIPYTINAANYSKLIQSLTITTGTSANPSFATLGVMAVSINTPLAVTVTPSLTSACAGQSVTFTATVTGTTGTVTYQWKKNGVNVGLNQPTYTDNTLLSTDVITVTVTPSSSTAVPSTVTSANLSIPTGAVPVAPTAISGPNPVCINSANTYSVPAVTGATSYTWTLPSGWSGTSNTTSITATSTISGGTITVYASNGCGPGPITSLAVSVVSNATPSVAISANPGATICSGTSVTFTATPTNGGGAPAYQWKKNNINVGTNSPTYTDAALANGDQITVVMTSSLGCSTTPTATAPAITMIVNTVPAQPGIISGSAAVCAGTSPSYSVVAVTGATSYTWTAPAGWNGSSTSPNINYTASANSGTITVTANNTCGPSTPRTLALTTTSLPATPGAITGNAAPCAFSSQTYSVAAVAGATNYIWSLPAGWNGSSSTTGITVATTNSSGTITVTANNGCGNSTSAASLAVNALTSTPAPGAITGSATPCSGTSQTYTVAAVTGATSYNWQLPNGWSGFSSTNSITATTSASGGQVQVSANNSCGFSAPSSLAVAPVLSVTPSVVVTTPSINICQTSSATFTANPSGGGAGPTYQWKKNGQNILGATGSTYTDNFLVNGDQISVVMTSNAPCATTTVVTSPALVLTISSTVIPGININTTPPTINCAGTPLVFTTNINGGGTAPVYQWYLNNNPVNGATNPTFASSSLQSGDTLTVRLTSNAACPSQNTVMSNKVGLDIRPNVTPTAIVTASPGVSVSPSTLVTFTANITNGGPTPTFQWYKNGLPMPFATNATYTTSGLHDGDLITVDLNSYAPCATPATVTSSALRMNVSTGIGNVTAAGSNWMGDISIYPNPTSGHFTIAADWGAGHNGERVKVELVNSLGQMVYSSELVPNAAQWTVPVWLGTEVANGLYQLHVHTDNMGIVRGISVQR